MAVSRPQHAPIDIEEDELHLWLIDEFDENDKPLSGALKKQYLSVISQEEHQRMLRFKFEKRQNMFLSTRAALRIILSFYMPDILPEDFSFLLNEYGKPSLEHASKPITFNLSHSRGKILIGISLGRELGVDIEYINPNRDVLKIADHYFHKKEWNGEVIDREHSLEYFYQLWTLKEAFIKAEGKGMYIPINSFYFTQLCDLPTVVTNLADAAPSKPWYFQQRILDTRHSVAFAIERFGGENVKVTMRQYHPLNSFSDLALF